MNAISIKHILEGGEKFDDWDGSFPSKKSAFIYEFIFLNIFAMYFDIVLLQREKQLPILIILTTFRLNVKAF